MLTNGEPYERPIVYKTSETLRIYRNYTIDLEGTIRNARTGRIKKTQPTKKGYRHVSLYYRPDDHQYTIRVPRAMIYTFPDVISPEVQGINKRYMFTVDHINSITCDDRAENLRLMTAMANQKDGWENRKRRMQAAELAKMRVNSLAIERPKVVRL